MELTPPKWMDEICLYLQQNEPESWEWFSSVEAQSDYADTLRMELLKSTYRLNPDEHASLYQTGKEVLEKLELHIPITLYQSQTASQASAAIFYLPGEAHVVFFGNILELLDDLEVKSVLGHELAHYKLWQEDDGKYLIADRFLNAMAGHSQADNAQLETVRRYQLFTEIYADRGSLFVCDDVNPAVSSLVKVHTGMKQVSAESYISQAEEIFSKGNVKTEGLSHPEAFIRTRALRLLQKGAFELEGEITDMIIGDFDIDDMDIVQQAELALQTTSFVKQIIQPPWLAKKEIFANRLALYSEPDLKHEASTNLEDYLKSNCTDSLKDYLAYIVIDFVALEEEIRSAVALYGLDLAIDCNFANSYEEKLLKELKIKKTEWKNWLKSKDSILKEVAGGA